MIVKDIIDALEQYAPLSRQEGYDNCGLLIGSAEADCSGVMLCVDVTERVVAEAVASGCNLIVSHHPLIFRGIKNIDPTTPQGRAIIAAIQSDVAVYACHTSIDAAPVVGVSAMMARMLDMEVLGILDEHADGQSAYGIGVMAKPSTPMDAKTLIEKVKDTFHAPVARCSRPEGGEPIERIAICSGSGGSLVALAIKKGAQAIITADVSYHTFVDFGPRILIVDIGHFETENCTKDIFYTIIREKFPNFATKLSETDTNPIVYL